MMTKVEKKILIRYTTSTLTTSKNMLWHCSVYICIDGTFKFVDTIYFHKDKLLELLNKSGTNGPIVLNYDEVMNG